MKILIIKMSSLGDVIHLLPAITDAAATIPDIELHWVVEKNFSEVPSWHRAITKIIPLELRKWRKSFFTLFKNPEVKNFLTTLRQENYDLIIDAQGLLKSAIVAKLARGKIKVGLDFASAREPCAALFYDKKIAVTKGEHAILRLRKLFAFALHYTLPTTEPDFGINAHFKTNANRENYVVFLHGTTRADKFWPTERWSELAKLSGAQKYQVYLPWGNAAEKTRAEKIAAEAAPFSKVLPKANLTTLAEALVNAKAVVAVDTGLGHLAAALNTPTISLYGNTDPKLIGATGKNALHLVAKRACPDFVGIEVAEVWQSLLKSLTTGHATRDTSICHY